MDRRMIQDIFRGLTVLYRFVEQIKVGGDLTLLVYFTLEVNIFLLNKR